MATSPAISRPASLRELINPLPPQQEFFDKLAEYDFVLYEGEASGGKSYALRWWLVDFLADCHETLGLHGVRVGLFCEDYPTLKDRHIVKIRAEFPPWLGTLTKTDGGLDYVLRPEYGSGAMALRNLDDPSKYFSAEFAAIAVEELTKHRLAVFNDLRFRLRWPGIERPKFAGATHPGGKGHQWVKKYWITKDYPPEFKGVDKRTGKAYDLTKQFARVTAKASDNPYIDENYHTRNLTLPPEMARRVALADWDIHTGMYFPYWNPKIHVVSHAEAMARIQPWHVRSLSGDWGFRHPHCFHWHAKDERNHIITHWELWDRGVNEAEVGRRITEAEAQFFKLAPLRDFTFSWDAGKVSPRSQKGQPKSITDLVAAALGARVPKPHPCESQPGVRLIRARLMTNVLGHPGDVEAGILPQPPTWLISDRCTKLIESIPSMLFDEDKPEEMMKQDYDQETIGDDPVDSAQMGLQWMIGTVTKPDQVRLEEHLAAVRQQFAARHGSQPKPAEPGQDWFAKFGGRKAQKR